MPGWRRTLAIMFLAQLLSQAGFSVTYPFFPLYVQHLGTHTGLSLEFLAGMTISSQALTMMFAAPFWGALADRHGRKLMVARAMFGGTILLLLMGYVRSAEELVLLRAIQGLITGTDSASNALVAACAPRERMGFAMGMLQVGLWAGIALGPIIGGPLADAYGFSVPFVVTAVLLGLAGLLVWFGVDEQFDPTQQITRKKVSFSAGWRHVLSMPGVPLTYSLRFLNALSRTMLTPILPLFIHSLMPTSTGVSTVTGIVVGAASASVTASAVYLGKLGDRLGHRRIIILSALATALIYMPQSFVTQGWQLVVLQMLTGAAAGGLISSSSALLARYTEPGEEGTVYGIDSTVVAGARALSPLLGATIAVGFGYRGVFTFTGLILLVVVFMAFRWLPHDAPEPQLETI